MDAKYLVRTMSGEIIEVLGTTRDTCEEIKEKAKSKSGLEIDDVFEEILLGDGSVEEAIDELLEEDEIEVDIVPETVYSKEDEEETLLETKVLEEELVAQVLAVVEEWRPAPKDSEMFD